MKVTLRKQIHSSFASASTGDVWVNKVIEMPFVPPVGMTIDGNHGFCETIKEIVYDFSLKRTTAYVEEDNTFSDVKEFGKNFADTPEFKALVQSYLDQGWEIKV